MPNKTTYNKHYNELSINTNEDKGLGCHTKVLALNYAHLNDMCSKHCKVWQQRFDLRYPADGSIDPDPKHRYRFAENLTKDLKRNNSIYAKKDKLNKKNPHNIDPRLIMVCEKGKTSNKIHIHGLLLVNGNSKKHSADIFARVERQWANALEIEDAKGLVHYCNANGPNSYMLNRNDLDFKDKLNAAFYQASYLAKINTKDGLEKGQWLVSSTRLPVDAKNNFNRNKINPMVGK